jgi:hypothetical protein
VPVRQGWSRSLGNGGPSSGSGKLLLAFASTVYLGVGLSLTHDCKFVLSKDFAFFFKWGLQFNEVRGLTTRCHPLVMGGEVTRLHARTSTHSKLKEAYNLYYNHISYVGD